MESGVAGRRPLAAFPFLHASLDRVEGIRRERLSCWLHCLRDCLYATGVTDCAAALAQPLNLAVERGARGELLTVYGGLDTHYHEPRFRRGLRAEWRRLPSSGAAALAAVAEDLARGVAHPVVPDFRHLSYSRYSRIRFDEYEYRPTIVVAGVDQERATGLVADEAARRTAGFDEQRGTVPIDALERSLAGGRVLSWWWEPPATDRVDELRDVLAESVARMTAGGPGRGLDAIAELPELVAECVAAPAPLGFLRRRLAMPLVRHVAGDRAMLALVLDRAPAGWTGTGAAADLLHQAADRWARLGRDLFVASLGGGTASVEVEDRCRELRRVEERVLSGLDAASRGAG